jgi:hypothetical protein
MLYYSEEYLLGTGDLIVSFKKLRFPVRHGRMFHTAQRNFGYGGESIIHRVRIASMIIMH